MSTASSSRPGRALEIKVWTAVWICSSGSSEVRILLIIPDRAASRWRPTAC
jgi:hypothetical protein